MSEALPGWKLFVHVGLIASGPAAFISFRYCKFWTTFDRVDGGKRERMSERHERIGSMVTAKIVILVRISHLQRLRNNA